MAVGRRRREGHARAEPHHPARRRPVHGRVPGVTHATAVWNALWETPAGAQLNVLAVDPASYAALVAGSAGYPQVQARQLAVPGRAGAPQPVLASPQAVADLGHGVVSLTTNQGVVAPVRVRVAGVVSSTPGLPGTPPRS